MSARHEQKWNLKIHEHPVLVEHYEKDHMMKCAAWLWAQGEYPRGQWNDLARYVIRMACSAVSSYARLKLGLRVGLYYGLLRADSLGGRYAHSPSHTFLNSPWSFHPGHYGPQPGSPSFHPRWTHPPCAIARPVHLLLWHRLMLRIPRALGEYIPMFRYVQVGSMPKYMYWHVPLRAAVGGHLL